METLAPVQTSNTRKGRPPGSSSGLPPSAYRHDLIKAKINSDRSYNVRKLSRELGISTMTFYRIMHGRGPASPAILEQIAEKLQIPTLARREEQE